MIASVSAITHKIDNVGVITPVLTISPPLLVNVKYEQNISLNNYPELCQGEYVEAKYDHEKDKIHIRKYKSLEDVSKTVKYHQSVNFIRITTVPSVCPSCSVMPVFYQDYWRCVNPYCRRQSYNNICIFLAAIKYTDPIFIRIIDNLIRYRILTKITDIYHLNVAELNAYNMSHITGDQPIAPYIEDFCSKRHLLTFETILRGMNILGITNEIIEGILELYNNDISLFEQTIDNGELLYIQPISNITKEPLDMIGFRLFFSNNANVELLKELILYSKC